MQIRFGAWIIRAGAELVPLVEVVVPVPLYPRRLIGRRAISRFS